LTISLGSHAAAEAQPLWPVLSDWAHLIAASVWVGGLLHFAVGLWSLRRSGQGSYTRLAAQLLPRFSALAIVSVGTLTLTGLYASLLRVGSLEALISTLYGRTLIVKLIIAALMAALGAINLLFVTPNMKRAAARPEGQPSLAARFRSSVTSEVTLGLVLLLSVGLLTSLPPARSTAEAPALTTSGTADDLKLDLTITPGRVGVNTFTLHVTSQGQLVDVVEEAALRFTPTRANVPPSEAPLIAQGNGEYSTQGAYLSLPDLWQVQAVVRRTDKFDAFANFNFDLTPNPAPTAFPWTRATGG
jgi:copper transport protein